jgi:hypothetical protein
MPDRMMTTPSATHCDPVRCFMAMELSKKDWIVAVHTPLGRPDQPVQAARR